MSGEVLLLLLANVLELCVGLGVVLALGLADTSRAFAARLGLAYGLGLAVTGILDATSAIARVPIGLPELAVLALGSLLVGLLRRSQRTSTDPQAAEPRTGSTILALGIAAITAGLLAVAAGAYAVTPLAQWDGWAIWGTKAQALYDFGSANGPLFTSPAYQGIQQSYPLLLPALEATDYRAMGAVDGSVIHLQLLLFAVAFAGSLFGLLWRRVPSELTALCVLAILAASPVLGQLGSNYADIPLAFEIALGVVALARWLTDDEPWLLPVAVVFLGAGVLTKNEGSMFAAAALLPLLVYLAARDRRRFLSLLGAAGAVAAILVPWRIFTSLNHLTAGDIHFSNALHPELLSAHASRVAPTVQSLVDEIGATSWGLLVPLTALGVLAAFVAGRSALVWFAATWLLLSFAGLVLVYWISSLPLDWYLGTSAYRIVATLVIGGASLTPLLAADAWAESKTTLHGLRRTRTQATRAETFPA
jgi:Dolichyl-phosphate-mannose-protein mannosyltransferase